MSALSVIGLFVTIVIVSIRYCLLLFSALLLFFVVLLYIIIIVIIIINVCYFMMINVLGDDSLLLWLLLITIVYRWLSPALHWLDAEAGPDHVPAGHDFSRKESRKNIGCVPEENWSPTKNLSTKLHLLSRILPVAVFQESLRQSFPGIFPPTSFLESLR